MAEASTEDNSESMEIENKEPDENVCNNLLDSDAMNPLEAEAIHPPDSDVVNLPDLFVFKEYYDLPVKRIVYGDLNFPVFDDVLRIKGNNICLRVLYTQPPEGTKPDRRHCLQIQLSFFHIHKFMFLAPESNDGATAMALAISDVAVLRINGAFSAALAEKVSGHPSRRYMFFDLMFNHKDPANKEYWKEVLRYISHGYNVQIQRRLASEKNVLSDKDYVELEKQLKVPYIGFVKKEIMMDLLKFSEIRMEVVQENGLEYIHFVPTDEKMSKPGDKRKEPAQITINDVSIPKLDKSDIIHQESASGRLEFNSNDLALLKPNAWLNDKIVDWYCYRLFKLLPEEKQARIHLCETHFYTSITKGIENERNPSKLKSGIFQNYEPKKYKQSFFDSMFIVVPIHRLNHWFLVVIIDPKAAVSQVESTSATSEEEPSYCHFLIFDSFKKLTTNEHDITFDHLTYFLGRHYDDLKRSLDGSDTFNRGLVKKVFPDKMPQQTNADDCGVYSLQFLKCFFDHLPEDNSLPNFSEWWKTFSIQGIRTKIHSEIITTATNYEEIKRRHEMIKEPPAKKPKIQSHPPQQIYRIAVPAPHVRPINAAITFRPRTPVATRLPTVPQSSTRATTTSKKAAGQSVGSSSTPASAKKATLGKRGSRKKNAEKEKVELVPVKLTSVEAVAPKSPTAPESTAPESTAPASQEPSSSANASLNATYESMGLQASDDENDA